MRLRHVLVNYKFFAKTPFDPGAAGSIQVAINCKPSKLRTGLRGPGIRNIFWAMPLCLQEKRPFSGKRFLKHVCFCAN